MELEGFMVFVLNQAENADYPSKKVTFFVVRTIE